jgi:quercetin dioxygenase-like cupin family protein
MSCSGRALWPARFPKNRLVGHGEFIVSKKLIVVAVSVLAGLALAAPAGDHSFALKTADVAWQPIHMEGMPEGLQARGLHVNPRTQMSSSIVQYPKGFHEPRHHHNTCGHYIYILKGRLSSPDGDLVPGMFTYAAPKEPHGPYTAVESTEIFFYTDGPLDFIVDK